MIRLSPRVRVRWAVSVVLLASVVAGGVAGAAVAVDAITLPTAAPFAVGGILGAFGTLHAMARYRRWRYAVEEDALYLERGVVTRVETAVPFVRIQHVDTRRGPIDRVLGLSSVVVYTAGSRGADVTVPGLTTDRAVELRNRLRGLATESEPEDAV